MSDDKPLTDAMIRNLKPDATDQWFTDVGTPGLLLKLTPQGKRVWVFRHRFGKATPSRRRLGRYPGMGLADARQKALAWQALLDNGRDPKEVEADQRKVEQQAREAAKQAEQEAKRNNFAKVAEAYIEGRAAYRRADKDAKAIRRHLVKAWGDRPISSITPRDVRDVIGTLAKRAPQSAREAWGHAVLIFKYAVHEELIATSPCASLDKRLTLNNAKLEPRKRILTDDECVALWRAATERGYPGGDMVRWLMLSGCRLSEALGACWQRVRYRGARHGQCRVSARATSRARKR